MAEDSSVQMSQGYDVIPPRRGRAYPILCEEWDHLKQQIGAVKTSFGLYNTSGSILLGAGISTLISILSGAYAAAVKTDANIIVIAWAATISCILIGAICMYFANESRNVAHIQAHEVIRQMDLIEKRYAAVEQG